MAASPGTRYLTVSLAADVEPYTVAMAGLRDALTRLSEQMADWLKRWSTISRRSGHRHAGTPGHRLRYTPARRDVPLGRRTAAKLGAL